jgi:hypothetical protein
VHVVIRDEVLAGAAPAAWTILNWTLAFAALGLVVAAVDATDRALARRPLATRVVAAAGVAFASLAVVAVQDVWREELLGWRSFEETFKFALDALVDLARSARARPDFYAVKLAIFTIPFVLTVFVRARAWRLPAQVALVALGSAALAAPGWAYWYARPMIVFSYILHGSGPTVVKRQWTEPDLHLAVVFVPLAIMLPLVLAGADALARVRSPAPPP